MNAPPRSARILTSWVDQYARREGEAPSRVRNWVSFMMVAGALQRAGFVGDGPRFTVKGGVALEMRLRSQARATRDLDLVLAGSFEPIDALREALGQPYQGFTFRVRPNIHEMPNDAVRTELSLDYLGKPWGRVQVDLSPPEGEGAAVELVNAIDLGRFGLDGPASLPCIPLPYHVAQKLHAATRPNTPEWRNDRFRDLIDLLLMKEWITDVSVLLPACREVFALRGTHDWPPLLVAPEEWAAPFARMARDLNVATTDLHQAVIELRHFIFRIDDSAPVWPTIVQPRGLTATTWYYAALPDDSVVRVPFSSGDALLQHRGELADHAHRGWERDPGGMLLIGVVVFLLDRTPRFVERTAVRPIAVSPDAAGASVRCGRPLWESLALEIVRRARVPERAINPLAVFLSTREGRLPVEVASYVGESTQWRQKLWPEMGENDSPRVVWDLQASTHVAFAPPRRP